MQPGHSPAQVTRSQHTCAGSSARADDDPRDSRRDDGCADLVADGRRELLRPGAAPATAASVTGRRRLASLGTGDSTSASRRARSSASGLGTAAQNKPPLPCVDVRLPRPDQSRLVDRLVRPAPGQSPASELMRSHACQARGGEQEHMHMNCAASDTGHGLVLRYEESLAVPP